MGTTGIASTGHRGKPSARKTFRVLGMFNRSVIAHREKISGILRFASNKPDWDVKFLDTRTHSFHQAAAKVLAEWKPDAILTGPAGQPSIRNAGRRTLLVLLDVPPRTTKADGFVCADNAAIAKEGVSLLTRRGLRSLAYLGKAVTSELHHSNQRRKAFRKAAEDAGCRFFDLPDVNDEGLYWMDDLPQLAQKLTDLPKPCGVMAYCDQCAAMLFDACRMAWLAIPDQIAVVGVDNDPSICERTVPTMTSICPMFEAGGYASAELADAMLRRTCRKRRRPTVVRYGIGKSVERMSTQDINGKRRIALLAAEHMRLHYEEDLTVRSLADALNISVRLLELRFMEVFECTVKDELLRLRLEAVRRMLRRTDTPVCEVAVKCGFRSPANLMLLFKKRFGCTMTAYRRSNDGGDVPDKT